MTNVKKKKPLSLYERVAQTAANAALDENNDPGLRAYYAGLALHYDKKAQRERDENE